MDVNTIYISLTAKRGFFLGGGGGGGGGAISFKFGIKYNCKNSGWKNILIVSILNL